MSNKSDKDSKLMAASSNSLSTRDPLQSYLDEIKKYPLLTREQERELALKYYESDDSEAAQRLVTSNLRFVVKVATEYSKFGAKLIDLIQEGNMGLMKAIKEFNPYKDVKLITYAVWWIRGYIQDYLMRQHSMVRIGTTNSQKKLFYNLKKEKDKLIQEGEEPTVKLLSSRLGVSEKDVKLMDNRLASNDLSLDQPMGHDETTSLIDLQKDSYEEVLDESLALKENMEILAETLKDIKDDLSDREKLILKERVLADEPKKLSDFGKDWGVSREAARQTEARLIKKIKKAFLSETDES